MTTSTIDRPFERLPDTARSLARIAGGKAGARPMQVALHCYYEDLTVDGFLYKNTEATIGANLLQPYMDLHAWGKEHGMNFVTLDQVSDFTQLDAVVFMDRPRLGNPLVEKAFASNACKYLLIYECEVIKPDNWETAYHKQFTRVFTWSDAHVDGDKYIKSNFAIDTWPALDFEALKGAFGQRKLASMIAGAKGSPHPFELYSDRVRAIRWFENSAPDDFDLYGGGWEQGDFPSHRGRVDDKLATAARYKFAICYENAKLIPGYITEKILDCFRAGTVPVYGGAPNITRWVPADCFIDIGQFQTYNQMHTFLSTMDEASYNGYLDRIADFMASGKAYPFSNDCFVATVSSFVAFDVQQRRGETPEGAPATPPGTELALMQDLATMQIAMHVRPAAPAPQFPRASVGAAARPDLIVYFGYGDELPVFQRARALWQFYLSHFPQIKAFFVRESAQLSRGELVDNGHDLIVGTGGAGDAPLAAGYQQTGVWSASQNAQMIHRQMAVHDYLLRKYPQPFFLYHATVTSVVDFRGLLAVLDTMPPSGCLAGMPGRLSSPPDLAGLSFICNTNSLMSRDIVELMRNRYDPHHPHVQLPDDVWQALLMHDVPRQSLPFFSFTQPRAPGAGLEDVAALAKRLLADGHFHFRIKTGSAEAGLGKREDVDPWIMLKLMETILASEPVPGKSAQLCAALHACTNTPAPGFPAYTDDSFFRGPRAFALTDVEAPILYPHAAG